MRYIIVNDVISDVILCVPAKPIRAGQHPGHTSQLQGGGIRGGGAAQNGPIPIRAGSNAYVGCLLQPVILLSVLA